MKTSSTRPRSRGLMVRPGQSHRLQSPPSTNRAPDDHASSRRSDITQRFLQRPPPVSSRSVTEHPNAGDVFLAAAQTLDGVDYLLEDDECLEISRLRVSDVSRLGVYRGRPRDEDVWSFSDRPGIPELEFVGVRGGIGKRPRGGGLASKPRCLGREVRYIDDNNTNEFRSRFQVL